MVKLGYIHPIYYEYRTNKIAKTSRHMGNTRSYVLSVYPSTVGVVADIELLPSHYLTRNENSPCMMSVEYTRGYH